MRPYQALEKLKYEKRYLGVREVKRLEAIVARSAQSSYDYAKEVKRGDRFPLGEPVISKSGNYALYYTLEILGRKPWPAAEKAIARDGLCACIYAGQIIKGRWEPGEKAMMKNPRFMLDYALDALNGRLPEPMHNAMVLFSFGDEDQKEFVKQYFDLVKKTEEDIVRHLSLMSKAEREALFSRVA